MEKPLIWSNLEEKFIPKTIIGANIDISDVTVPISSLIHPLCVIPDYGGHSTSFIVVLPKHNWSRYFGDRIMTEFDKYNL